MTKLAHAKAEETDINQTTELDFGMDKAYLKKKKEDEIRLQLDEFAKELARVSRQRKES
jgi:hypothetical protein